VTLRGRVLPVGGIKMKILAAHRAGLTTVILPKRNGKDLEDVPAEVRGTMNFILVDHIDEAIDAGLRSVADGFDPADPGIDRLLNQPGTELLAVTAARHI
jgi:ATP-dependent Lon protease